MKAIIIIIGGSVVCAIIALLWAATGKLPTHRYQLGILEKQSIHPSTPQNELRILTANLAFCGGITGLEGGISTREHNEKKTGKVGTSIATRIGYYGGARN